MDRKIKVALFAIIAVSLNFSNATDYCNIESCNPRDQQTLCKYPNAGPSSKCYDYQGSGLTDDQKQGILNLHNYLRHNVAIGNESRGNPGPQPAAKYMPNLQWDDEIASVAQRWADQCTWGHDSCRNVERFPVGQNIASSGTTANVDTIDVVGMVESWYNEVKDFSKYQVAKFSGVSDDGKVIGHYTQLVWAETTYLGCGATKYKDGDYNTVYLVCDYGPTGNWIGEPVYEAV